MKTENKNMRIMDPGTTTEIQTCSARCPRHHPGGCRIHPLH